MQGRAITRNVRNIRSVKLEHCGYTTNSKPSESFCTIKVPIFSFGAPQQLFWHQRLRAARQSHRNSTAMNASNIIRIGMTVLKVKTTKKLVLAMQAKLTAENGLKFTRPTQSVGHGASTCSNPSSSEKEKTSQCKCCQQSKLAIIAAARTPNFKHFCRPRHFKVPGKLRKDLHQAKQDFELSQCGINFKLKVLCSGNCVRGACSTWM